MVPTFGPEQQQKSSVVGRTELVVICSTADGQGLVDERSLVMHAAQFTYSLQHFHTFKTDAVQRYLHVGT